MIEYANHIHGVYPGSSLIFEPYLASEIHSTLPFPVYALQDGQSNAAYQDKVDLTTTLGGDGTILHAASLFATAKSVPPILSFSMGTLGFLGEWKFNEYKRAFREVYVSGAPSPLPARSTDEPVQESTKASDGWVQIRGKSMGASRNSSSSARGVNSHGSRRNSARMARSRESSGSCPACAVRERG